VFGTHPVVFGDLGPFVEGWIELTKVPLVKHLEEETGCMLP